MVHTFNGHNLCRHNLIWIAKYVTFSFAQRRDKIWTQLKLGKHSHTTNHKRRAVCQVSLVSFCNECGKKEAMERTGSAGLQSETKQFYLTLNLEKWKNCEVETLKMWWNKQLLLIEVQYHRDHSCLQLFYIYTFTTRILSQENSILLGHDIDLI